jgi:hypothetical protein
MRRPQSSEGDASGKILKKSWPRDRRFFAVQITRFLASRRSLFKRIKTFLRSSLSTAVAVISGLKGWLGVFLAVNT